MKAVAPIARIMATRQMQSTSNAYLRYDLAVGRADRLQHAELPRPAADDDHHREEDYHRARAQRSGKADHGGVPGLEQRVGDGPW